MKCTDYIVNRIQEISKASLERNPVIVALRILEERWGAPFHLVSSYPPDAEKDGCNYVIFKDGKADVLLGDRRSNQALLGFGLEEG